MDEYHQALNSRPLMVPPMREILDFVAPHFHLIGALVLSTATKTRKVKMRKMGMIFHGFMLVGCLASSLDFGEFVVL